MATTISLNGKTIKRPGVYALTKSGIQRSPQALPYGNVIIIDQGLGIDFAGGAGVDGQGTQGSDSVYTLTTPQQYQDFMKGGPLWDLAEPLFKPSKNATYPGVSKVYFIKAATTTPAAVEYEFVNGTLTLETIDEGFGANGVVETTNLVKGYAMKIVKSLVSPTKYVARFYHGTYAGEDVLNNIPYNTAYDSEDGVNFLSSPDISTLAELETWCNNSSEFRAVFKFISLTNITAEGVLTTADIKGYVTFEGATAVYNSANFALAIDAVKDLDNSFFLALDSGTDATNLNNTRIFDFIVNDSKYEKFMIVPGGYDKAQFAGADVGDSEYTVKYYNSDKVIVVHGGSKKTARVGMLLKSQLHKAAKILGRACGLPPQTPLTFKDIDIDGEVHKLSDSEKEFALDKGILTTHYDEELDYFVIQQGINSLQNNAYLVNEDGSSHDIAVKRITAYLNKSICVNAKKVFFGKNTGPNRATASPEDVKAWLEGFLQKQVASTLQDNLIIRFGNIQVTVQEDNYFITYEFVPNFPISKMVFTGIILEK